MSNKAWKDLTWADQKIRELSPGRGMEEGPQVRVTLIRGFELFNTRPYHNYETWSDGYVVELLNEKGEPFITTKAEDLDDALRRALELKAARDLKAQG